jgi:hypothetical protein
VALGARGMINKIKKLLEARGNIYIEIKSEGFPELFIIDKELFIKIIDGKLTNSELENISILKQLGFTVEVVSTLEEFVNHFNRHKFQAVCDICNHKTSIRNIENFSSKTNKHMQICNICVDKNNLQDKYVDNSIC